MKRLILAAIFVAGSTFSTQADTAFVSVTGEGRVEMVPDMAIVSLGVTHQRPTAGAAMDAVAKATRAIFSELDDFAIDAKDIQTTGLNLHPVFDRRNNSGQPPKIVGFSGNTTLTIVVRDLDKIGGLLDEIVDVGANRLQGISFDISDKSDALTKARIAAVNDAKAKAATMAEAAGAKLGRVLELSESGPSFNQGPMIRAEMAMADAMPIAAGSQSLLVQVWSKFELN